MTGALILPVPAEAPTFGTVLAHDNSMAPQIPVDSVVFLGREGEWHGDAVYCFGISGEPCGIYRAQARFNTGDVRTFKDNAPVEQIVKRAELPRTQFWPVVGVARPYTPEFAAYLRARFLDL